MPAPRPQVVAERLVPTEHGHGHGHGRAHGHAHDPHRTPKRVLALALVLTSSFMVVEAAVGYLAGSLALVADAGHMLADAGALGLALLAQAWASKPRTERSTFGFRRAEVLAAFVNGVALALTGVLVVKEAVARFMRPIEIDGARMLLVATAGLIVNIVVAGILVGAQRHSLNVRAAFAHVLTDAFGSVAAITAGLAVVFLGWTRADPILSVVIALLVAYSGWRVLKETTAILLEAAPKHLNVTLIERAILETPGVQAVHDLHVWRISDRFDALTVHVILKRGAHGTDVCQAVGERVRRDFGLDHITVQPEAPPPDDLVNVRSSRHGGPITRAG